MELPRRHPARPWNDVARWLGGRRVVRPHASMFDTWRAMQDDLPLVCDERCCSTSA
jgi:hypothetical protein